MNVKILGTAIAGLLIAVGATNVQAQAINIGTATVSSAAGGPAAIDVAFDAEGRTDIGSYNTVIIYDDTILTGAPTISNDPDGLCVVTAASQQVSFAVFAPGATGLPSRAICTINFDVTPGTAVNTYPVAHDPAPGSTSFGDMDANVITGTVNDGAIDVVAEGPPTITFPAGPFVLPPAGFGMSTNTTIPVTVTDGGGNNPANTASYTCTAPAGFTVSPLAGGPIANGGTLADLDVSCTTGAAAVNGNISCTATNTTPSSVNFTIPVTCPAGTMAAPNLTPTPAAGGTVTVGAGAPGATACGTISIAASGGAGTDEATVTCTSGDAAVTVNPAGPLTFGVGAAPQTIQVCTTLTDTAQTFTDVITCTGDDGNGSIDWAPFSVAAAAGSTAPRFVPASSLWSKLALFGIFGALGMLIIGLRRSH